jgi:hypothetical protein
MNSTVRGGVAAKRQLETRTMGVRHECGGTEFTDHDHWKFVTSST